MFLLCYLFCCCPCVRLSFLFSDIECRAKAKMDNGFAAFTKVWFAQDDKNSDFDAVEVGGLVAVAMSTMCWNHKAAKDVREQAEMVLQTLYSLLSQCMWSSNQHKCGTLITLLYEERMQMETSLFLFHLFVAFTCYIAVFVSCADS